MKKKIFGKKLSRERDTRRALFRSLVRAVVLHGSIETTKSKAKAVQVELEKLATLAKKEDIAAKRAVYSILANDRQTADKLAAEVKERFADLVSGFTKLVNLPERRGDNAPMVRLSWSRGTKVAESAKGGKKEIKSEAGVAKVNVKNDKSAKKSKVSVKK